MMEATIVILFDFIFLSFGGPLLTWKTSIQHRGKLDCF
jgi:hypothetical protein